MDVLTILTLPTRLYESIPLYLLSLLGIWRAAVNVKLFKQQKNRRGVLPRRRRIRPVSVCQPRLSIGTNFKFSGPM